MMFRRALRALILAALLYAMTLVFPAYAREYCGVAEHAKQSTCQAFFTLETTAAQVQHDIARRVEPYTKRVRAHPWTSKAIQAYGNTPVPALLTRAQVWVETEGKPRAVSATSRATAITRQLAEEGYVVSAEWAKRSGVASRRWAERSYSVMKDFSRRAYAASAQWARTRALPFIKEQLHHLKVHIARLARLAWKRAHDSRLYNEWLLPQYRKIVTGPAPHLSSRDASSGTHGGSTAMETPEATPSAAEHPTQIPAHATPSSLADDVEPEEAPTVSAMPSETAETNEVRAATVSRDTETESEPPRTEPSKVSRNASTLENEEPAAPGPVAGEPVVPIGSHSDSSDHAETLEASPLAPATRETKTREHEAPLQRTVKRSWLSRLSRTVEGAVASMEEDGMTLAKRSVSAAKPEIMSMLREINTYGDGAVKESTTLADELETRSRQSRQITREDVYPGFEAASREMAEMALKVRGRAEKLANDVLDGLVSVRKVTLDALDDYFDVVLVEAAKQISDDDNEVEAWKEYAMLKQKMREYRKQVEEHEFDMEDVNIALRESQLASVVLVQDFNKQLTEQRARCQLVLQEREPPAEPEPPLGKREVDLESTQSNAALDTESRGSDEEHNDTDDEEALSEAEHREARESPRQVVSESASVRHAKPAAYVVDDPILLDEEPVAVPFDTVVEDSGIIETDWEPLAAPQTDAA